MPNPAKSPVTILLTLLLLIPKKYCSDPSMMAGKSNNAAITGLVRDPSNLLQDKTYRKKISPTTTPVMMHEQRQHNGKAKPFITGQVPGRMLHNGSLPKYVRRVLGGITPYLFLFSCARSLIYNK